jgi:3alpha(or 20beta)-hydroxysteroid dehydrogenase
MTNAQGRLAGRVAVVSGGARGIGEATVRRFVAEGASVLLVDIDDEGAARVAAEAATTDSAVMALHADIGTEAGWTDVHDHLRDTFGRLDIVVNNATGPEVGPLLGISEAGWQRTFDTNVTAVWRSAKALAPLLQLSGAGVMVNLSSNAGLRAVPGLGAYGAAKAAIISLTRSLAIELAPLGIRANSITPGVILSPMIKAQVERVGQARFERNIGTRCGTTDELAAVITFLVSDDASYVNGENIQVDGGWFAGDAIGDSLAFGSGS